MGVVAIAAVAAAVATAMDPEAMAREKEKGERRAPTLEEKEPARARDPWIFLPEEKVSE